MHARTYSATHRGLDGLVIEVEATKQRALPKIHITGLPGDVVRESRERVQACLGNLGFDIPSARLVVHLSPASARKQGSQFDLAIALSCLAAEGMVKGAELSRTAFLGELSLDGRVHPVAGAVALIEALEKTEEISRVLIPRENAWEASLVTRGKSRPIDHVGEAIAFLRGERELALLDPTAPSPSGKSAAGTLDSVIGQNLAKRALQIALAGRHHVLLVGPPGVGKSLLASLAPSLLPPLDRDELIECVKNYGVLFSPDEFDFSRPFRSPHHSISAAALLGGGSGTVLPGEVTLAHGGVLFLDELPEFRRDVVEGIREPLQVGRIHLHRVGAALTLPARFTLVAAMNPCPCGYSLGPAGRCSCAPDRVRSYRKRISGPIMDRMDLCVVLGLPRGTERNRYPHAELCRGIFGALSRQWSRYGAVGKGLQNGDLTTLNDVPGFEIEGEEKAWLEHLSEAESMSYRGWHKILKVARTIADLESDERIRLRHLQEAWELRCQSLAL